MGQIKTKEKQTSVGGRRAGRETGPNVSPVRQGINQGGEDFERKSEEEERQMSGLAHFCRSDCIIC